MHKYYKDEAKKNFDDFITAVKHNHELEDKLKLCVHSQQSKQYYCKDESYHKVGRCSKQCGDCKDIQSSLQ